MRPFGGGGVRNNATESPTKIMTVPEPLVALIPQIPFEFLGIVEIGVRVASGPSRALSGGPVNGLLGGGGGLYCPSSPPPAACRACTLQS